jgi:hypothetical protein
VWPNTSFNMYAALTRAPRILASTEQHETYVPNMFNGKGRHDVPDRAAGRPMSVAPPRSDRRPMA